MLGSRSLPGARTGARHKTRQAQDLHDCARMLGISADEFRKALLSLGTQQDTAARSPRKPRADK